MSQPKSSLLDRSLSFSQIHLDFEVAVEKFKGVPYDILDVAAKQVCPQL